MRNRFNIEVIENKGIDKLERLAEIKIEAMELKQAGLKLNDFSSDDFKAFYSDWSCKDLKCLNKLMGCME